MLRGTHRQLCNCTSLFLFLFKIRNVSWTHTCNKVMELIISCSFLTMLLYRGVRCSFVACLAMLTVSNWSCLVNDELEKNYRGLFWGIMPEFVWKGWGLPDKPQDSSLLSHSILTRLRRLPVSGVLHPVLGVPFQSLAKKLHMCAPNSSTGQHIPWVCKKLRRKQLQTLVILDCRLLYHQVGRICCETGAELAVLNVWYENIVGQ